MALLTNPTDLARETLKLMAARRIAPTPENYARCYHEIAGTAPERESGAEARIVQALRQAANANPALAVLARLARDLESKDLQQFNAGLIALAGRDGEARRDWASLLRELVRQLGARQTATSQA